VLELESPAGLGKGLGAAAGAVVGAQDADAEAGIVGPGGLQEGDGALLALVAQDLGEGDARGVVEADVDELPADPAALAAPPTGDAMADLVEASELLDVDVEPLARVGALVASDRCRRRQVLDAAQPEPSQDATDGGRRDTDLLGDLVTGPALPTPRGALPDDGLRCRLAQQLGPRGAIEQPAAPSAWQRAHHLFTVLTLTPKAAATALGACAMTSTRRPSSARPCGVSRAFWWMSIRSSPAP
jgi:hypothetical protein